MSSTQHDGNHHNNNSIADAHIKMLITSECFCILRGTAYCIVSLSETAEFCSPMYKCGQH